MTALDFIQYLDIFEFSRFICFPRSLWFLLIYCDLIRKIVSIMYSRNMNTPTVCFQLLIIIFAIFNQFRSIANPSQISRTMTVAFQLYPGSLHHTITGTFPRPLSQNTYLQGNNRGVETHKRSNPTNWKFFGSNMHREVKPKLLVPVTSVIWCLNREKQW